MHINFKNKRNLKFCSYFAIFMQRLRYSRAWRVDMDIDRPNLVKKMQTRVAMANHHFCDEAFRFRTLCASRICAFLISLSFTVDTNTHPWMMNDVLLITPIVLYAP